MAASGHPFPIWDRRNVKGQKLVDVTPCRKLLQEAGVILRRNLRTDDVLPHLLQLGVIDRVQMESITHAAPRAIIVDRLIAFLLTCEVWQFHGLLRACAVTGQAQLIKEVGLTPRDYISEEEEAKLQHPSTEESHETKTSQKQSSSAMPAQLLKAIVHHCKNCKRCLMRRNLYDFGNKEAVKVVDTTTCHITVNPLCEGEKGKMTEITEKDILLALPGKEPPRVIRLEGQPGVGKTDLTHHVAYDWSIEFLKRVEEGIPIEIGGDLLTTIVHIPARSIKTTVDDAIYDNLRCPREDKPVLFCHVRKGNGTAIELDGIDEIRDSKVMENVREYIRERQMTGDGPIVLLTSRTDLCPIDLQDIDRFVTVQGFSLSQGFSYIKAYLEDDQNVYKKVLDYVQAHQQRLFAILTNPLRLHIFCALVSEGELELDANGDFCILKLFSLLEQCLLKREEKKVTQVEMHNFYRMCIYGLLNGLREFSKELLDRFNIAEACHVFFSRKDTTSVLEKQVSYSFPHEMMYEFFAGKYIETLSLDDKKTLLLSVCAKPSLRNLQKIMFEVILQQEQQQELLLMMIRAIIILQHEPAQSHSQILKPQGSKKGLLRKVKRLLTSKPLDGELMLLKSKVEPIESVTSLLLEQHCPTEAKNTGTICAKINKAFDGNRDFLREVKWYHGLGDGVFSHISECLQACDALQNLNLTSQSTERLLPCNYMDEQGQHMVHMVGGSRWAEVGEHQRKNIHAWCPADVQEVMGKVRMSGFTSTDNLLYISLDTYQDMWGQPNDSAFSKAAWNELYREIREWESTVAMFKTGECKFNLRESTPIHGLLQSNVGHILQGTYKGTIGMEELYQIHNAAHLPVIQRCMSGSCVLLDTTIVVPRGGDKAVLSKMKYELLAVHKPKLVKPRFVTETWDNYDWSW